MGGTGPECGDSGSGLPRHLFLCAVLFVCGGPWATRASCQVPPAAAPQAGPQGGGTITAVPNRPTFSTTAETVQAGVFEIEYGFEAAQGHQNINGLLKFGLIRNLELRFANNPIVRDDGFAALGDSAAGLKYQFAGQRGALPALAVLYTATLPTAGGASGAGALQHSVGILVSKDFGKHHLDFNENVEWRGRRDARGFDRDYFTALAYSHPFTDRWGFSVEIAGFSRVNDATPATVTLLQALTYNAAPRLVLDAGFYVAARGDLPRATFFAGVTYSVADLYGFLRRCR